MGEFLVGVQNGYDFDWTTNLYLVEGAGAEGVYVHFHMKFSTKTKNYYNNFELENVGSQSSYVTLVKF